MKVLSLEMASFCGFSKLSLDFTAPVSVIVGTNGAGKTSILYCLAVLLSQLSWRITLSSMHGPRFDEADIQNGKPHTFNTIKVESGGTSASWSLALVRKGYPREVSSNLGGLKELVAQAQQQIASGAPRLPLAIYYPVNRAPEVPDRIREHHGFDPLASYDQALGGGGRNFRLFFEWFREREDLENEQRLEKKQYDYRDFQLEAVRAAIVKLVPGFSDLRVQRAPQRMVVQKDGALLEINQLSDGEKCLLAMAGDLGRRLALANPSLQDPLSAEAVVLIDEIELHLHPGWQRMVVERLRETFPGCQFIMTTHSPQVLSQIPARSVILLERFQQVQLLAGTEGRDSNAILSEVMGVSERPPAWAERIHKISQLIDREALPEARQALDALALQLGQQDSEVVRLRALMGFLGG